MADNQNEQDNDDVDEKGDRGGSTGNTKSPKTAKKAISGATQKRWAPAASAQLDLAAPAIRAPAATATSRR